MLLEKKEKLNISQKDKKTKQKRTYKQTNKKERERLRNKDKKVKGRTKKSKWYRKNDLWTLSSRLVILASNEKERESLYIIHLVITLVANCVRYDDFIWRPR